MKRKWFAEEPIIGVLQKHEAGITAGDSTCKHGILEGRLCDSKAQLGGMDVSDAKRLRRLAEENGKLTRLLANAMLDNTALKKLLSKKMARPSAKREFAIEALQVTPQGLTGSSLSMKWARCPSHRGVDRNLELVDSAEAQRCEQS